MSEKTKTVQQFLNENAIQYKSCNLDKPFVFMSYSHASHDSIIIQSVFNMLYIHGFNLWIDVANIPFDHNSWQNAAFKALTSNNSKVALFFRSENSLTKSAVADEIERITANENTRIVTIDIWTSPKSTAQTVYNNLQLDVENNPEDESIKEQCEACARICDKVDVNNSAIRLAQECKNDVNLLVSKIAEVLNSLGVEADNEYEEDYDYNSTSSENKLKEYAEIANEEIMRNYEEYRNNDFGILADELKKIQNPLIEIEEIYKQLGKVLDKNKGLKRSILFRRDIILRIFWITFVVFAVGFVFISTLEGSTAYSILDDHLMALSIVTDLFTISFDDNVQLFVNTILVALFDSIMITSIIVFVPAIVKLIIVMINSVKINSLRKKGERLLKKNIPVIPRLSLNYICSFAVGFFIKCYRTRQETDIDGAIAAFNEYKKSPEGLRAIAEIAPWLHEMRNGLRKVGYKR